MEFKKLPLSPEMTQHLQSIGYGTMTPIQQATLPFILEGKDVIAQAKTGSGKTAAFGIGLLENLNVKKFRIQSLVLCPTRELAHQVATELRLLAKFKHNIKILMLCGGESFGKQCNSLYHEAHIIVGTPGRVLKHLNKETLKLEHLQTVVLDEADRMLDMGFIEEVESVLSFTPQKRQTLLFSATYNEEIMAISHKIQNNPSEVTTTDEEVANEIEEIFIVCEDKEHTLLSVFSTYNPKNSIVFVNTKLQADELAKTLQKKGVDALALHGDLEQYDRNDVLVQFSNGSCRVLIATDVASRGIDIKELSMVVNFDMPNTQEIYTHRIGRTGRAGAKGIAVTLVNTQEEMYEYEDRNIALKTDDVFELENDFTMQPDYVTLVIEGGKKDKLRAGDILGALTKDATLQGSDVGKIDIYERQSYVAIAQKQIDNAYKKLQNGKIKAKKFSVWVLS